MTTRSDAGEATRVDEEGKRGGRRREGVSEATEITLIHVLQPKTNNPISSTP